MANQSEIKGAIKIQGVPEAACYTTYAEFIRSLEKFLTVIIPNQTFSNIVISAQQPGSADIDKIWWRLGASGAFVGIFIYNAGVWVQIFPPPQQVAWLYGDSNTPPAGYSFTAVSTVFSAPDYAALIAMAIPAGPGPYSYFPVIYVGL